MKMGRIRGKGERQAREVDVGDRPLPIILPAGDGRVV